MNAATLIKLLKISPIIVVALIAFGRNEQKLTTIEARQKTIEENYVPRREHIEKDEWLRNSLKEINERLGRIEGRLMDSK